MTPTFQLEAQPFTLSPDDPPRIVRTAPKPVCKLCRWFEYQRSDKGCPLPSQRGECHWYPTEPPKMPPHYEIRSTGRSVWPNEPADKCPVYERRK